MTKNIIYLIILLSIVGLVWSWDFREKDTTTNEPLSVECTADQRNADFCVEIYQPVCATVNIQCIKAPCDPIKETFANSCKACSNSLVSSYVEGECEVEKTTEKSHKDISYNIEGESFVLKDGYSEETVLLNSASNKKITRYFGNEAVGDLNGDEKEDVAFLLTQETGGSGVFYYAVVALKTNTGYKGTDAILLGDRIAPQTTEIRDDILIVNYADRNINEPMTTSPSVGVSAYLKINKENLEKIKPLSYGEQVLWGDVVMGHETRSFRPCSGKQDYWILGNSPAYNEMLTYYQDWVKDQNNPYEPVLMVLAGNITDTPKDGFGADYDYGFNATQILSIIPDKKCE